MHKSSTQFLQSRHAADDDDDDDDDVYSCNGWQCLVLSHKLAKNETQKQPLQLATINAAYCSS